MVRLKGEKLMVVPSTADGFRAVVIALRSLDGKEVVSFHTFILPEERCLRLLIKNLGKGKPESFVREELESLNIRVQGVTQLRSGVATWTPPRTALPTPTSLYQWREGLRCRRCDHSPNSAPCECWRSRMCIQKTRCNVSAASALATRSVTVDTHSGASPMKAPTSPVAALPRRNSLGAVAESETTQRTTLAV